MTFKSGHSIGRPKGSRNKLDKHVYELVLSHVKHKIGDPAPPEYAQTSLWAALSITLVERPNEYLRQIISMLPKQVELEHAASSLDDDELEHMIVELRAAIEEKRPLLLEARNEQQAIAGSNQSTS